ncbi:uncharacterized protein CC84DRAFT_862419 [Paraphaeosphaeria sporulosa]|uniref:Uncharacterized protein n=1 Tax=Paraphaeosphaeria sporulosa TaxID=1460663 RepID=A0A177C7C6_9PLEO|nr:uncharacterized protein CC84DRAFT_862419 [Paraphaeosphaeria sporulosa]OAG03654.1 hypothetical protein CC84DRAFT_862419 [Paraphaeosphaeria sporulosa]
MPTLADVPAATARDVGLLVTKASFRSLASELASMIAEAMQTNEETGEPECILSTNDLCNLRLVNRQTAAYVQRTFAVRFFRHRKHLLSEHGLNALIRIARHSVFSTYVQKLSLGPERMSKLILPPALEPAGVIKTPYIIAQSQSQSSDAEASYISLHGKKMHDAWSLWYRVRIGEQEAFHNSDRGTLLLKETLRHFTDLRVISIESYPGTNTDRGYDGPWSNWTLPWGANTLVRELDSIITPHRVDARRLFYDVDPDIVNWHLNPILEALEVIKGRPNWRMEFYLNSGEKYVQAGSPFNIDSLWWQACKGRVQHVHLHRSIQTMEKVYDRANWLTKLLESCGRCVEEMSCQNTFYWSKIVCNAPLPALRRLNIHHATVQDMYFDTFLERHAECLESINLSRVGLSIIDLRQVHEDMYPTVVLQAAKYEREDASWRRKFKLMLKLVQLRSIQLEHLTWVHGSLGFSHKRIPQVVGSTDYGRWKTTVMAEGEDIKTLLNQAIRDDKITLVWYEEDWVWEVVFLEEKESVKMAVMESLLVRSVVG